MDGRAQVADGLVAVGCRQARQPQERRLTRRDDSRMSRGGVWPQTCACSMHGGGALLGDVLVDRGAGRALE